MVVDGVVCVLQCFRGAEADLLMAMVRVADASFDKVVYSLGHSTSTGHNQKAMLKLSNRVE